MKWSLYLCCLLFVIDLYAETQTFINRTPYNLNIVVNFQDDITTTVYVPAKQERTINTGTLCTNSFVIYAAPSKRMPGELPPGPTSVGVYECGDRKTYINYEKESADRVFYTSTAHII